jgi:hypothetical protein
VERVRLARARREKAQELPQEPPPDVRSEDAEHPDVDPWSQDKLRLSDHYLAKRAKADFEKQDRLREYRHSGRQPLEPEQN